MAEASGTSQVLLSRGLFAYFAQTGWFLPAGPYRMQQCSDEFVTVGWHVWPPKSLSAWKEMHYSQSQKWQFRLFRPTYQKRERLNFFQRYFRVQTITLLHAIQNHPHSEKCVRSNCTHMYVQNLLSDGSIVKYNCLQIELNPYYSSLETAHFVSCTPNGIFLLLLTKSLK